MKCERCNIKIDGKYGSGRFCSRSCPNSHIVTDEHKKKTSGSIKQYNIDHPRKKLTYSESLVRVKKMKETQAKNGTWEKKRKQIEKRLLKSNFDDISIKKKKLRLLLECDNKCTQCGISKWQGEKLSLQLDHIDGNRDNNARDNLRILCPNCHSITETYSGKNTKANKNRNRYTDKDWIDEYDKHNKISIALRRLGLAINGANYKKMKRLIGEKYDLLVI